MSWTTARQAEQGSVGWCYQRRRPEQTLLYQLVESSVQTQYLGRFAAMKPRQSPTIGLKAAEPPVTRAFDRYS